MHVKENHVPSTAVSVVLKTHSWPVLTATADDYGGHVPLPEDAHTDTRMYKHMHVGTHMRSHTCTLTHAHERELPSLPQKGAQLGTGTPLPTP